MNALEVAIEGIGLWAPGWRDWTTARRGLLGDAEADAGVIKPSADLLPPAERRRAPMPVLLACDVAAQACAQAGRAPDSLPSVFVSTHGDLQITDYMCSTLAGAPRELSPIRFHNSVHNAPAGYWTIAAQCHQASTSISSWHCSFANALLETAVQALSENSPVLLAAYDAQSTEILSAVSPSNCLFGVAMVIGAPRPGLPRLRLQPGMRTVPASDSARVPEPFHQLARENPMAAQAMPVLAALAAGVPGRLQLPSGAASGLQIEVLP